MLSRQSCLSSGVTPRSFARHRRKNPLPASSGRRLPLLPRPASPTHVSAVRADPRSRQVRSPSFAPQPVASICTIAAAPPRAPSPVASRSCRSSSAPELVAGTPPAYVPIFVSVSRTSLSPFVEECPNSNCLNLGAQSIWYKKCTKIFPASGAFRRRIEHRRSSLSRRVQLWQRLNLVPALASIHGLNRDVVEIQIENGGPFLSQGW